MSERAEQKIVLAELSIYNIIIPDDDKLSTCHHCKKIITDSVYENTKCEHFSCRICYNKALAEELGDLKICDFCNITNWTRLWFKSNMLTYKLQNLSL